MGHTTTLTWVGAGLFDALAVGHKEMAVQTNLLMGQRDRWGSDVFCAQRKTRPAGAESTATGVAERQESSDDVTNLCNDEIYLLSPNGRGLWGAARCLMLVTSRSSRLRNGR